MKYEHAWNDGSQKHCLIMQNRVNYAANFYNSLVNEKPAKCKTLEARKTALCKLIRASKFMQPTIKIPLSIKSQLNVKL